MKILKVPYAEKDQAKALGARWNQDRKSWYVPDGQPTAPFAQWLVAGGEDDGKPGASNSAGKARVDSYAGAPVVGAHYIELEHVCNPFVVCEQCAPLLVKSGWMTAHGHTASLIQAIRAA